jgi:hypothetical protein
LNGDLLPVVWRVYTIAASEEKLIGRGTITRRESLWSSAEEGR